MKNKGFIKLTLILLAVVCLMLPISCCTNQHSKDSNKGNSELQDGMTIIVEISIADILNTLSNNSQYPPYLHAIEVAKQAQANGEKDVLGTFFQALDDDIKLAYIFSTDEMKDKISLTDSNKKVEDIIRKEVNAVLNTSFNLLRTRISNFGVSHPKFQKLDILGQVLIELPGVKDEERVCKLIHGTGYLEFYETYNLSEILSNLNAIQLETDSIFQRLMLSNNAYNPVAYNPVVGVAHHADTAAIMSMLTSLRAKELLPSQIRFAWSAKPSYGNNSQFELIALKTTYGGAILDGSVITDADADFSQYSVYAKVNMAMNSEGAKKWQQITGENIGRSIAIVLDGYVYSFPTVLAEISGGRSEITGNFTVEEAKDLANILKSGRIYAPARVISLTCH